MSSNNFSKIIILFSNLNRNKDLVKSLEVQITKKLNISLYPI